MFKCSKANIGVEFDCQQMNMFSVPDYAKSSLQNLIRITKIRFDWSHFILFILNNFFNYFCLFWHRHQRSLLYLHDHHDLQKLQNAFALWKVCWWSCKYNRKLYTNAYFWLTSNSEQCGNYGILLSLEKYLMKTSECDLVISTMYLHQTM